MSLLPFKAVDYCKRGLSYSKRAPLEQRRAVEPETALSQGLRLHGGGRQASRGAGAAAAHGQAGDLGRELPEDPTGGAPRGPRAPYPGDHEQHQLSLCAKKKEYIVFFLTDKAY